jgi:hypothetical protein
LTCSDRDAIPKSAHAELVEARTTGCPGLDKLGMSGFGAGIDDNRINAPFVGEHA